MEKLWTWVSWKLPRKLVYWASVRLMAYATTGEHASKEAPKVTILDALQAW